MGSGSVGSGFGVRGLVLRNRTRRRPRARKGTGSVGAPTLQINPVCLTYLHIAVERLFEHEDEHDFEARCGPKNLLT
jgi:hypothetical protein